MQEWTDSSPSRRVAVVLALQQCANGESTAVARRRGDVHAGGVEDVGLRLERAIDALLDDRRAGATICPSEAARAVDPEGWRELMPAAREAAGRLAAAGQVEVTQRGEVVDVATARGPVRVRRRRSSGEPLGRSEAPAERC